MFLVKIMMVGILKVFLRNDFWYAWCQNEWTFKSGNGMAPVQDEDGAKRWHP